MSKAKPSACLGTQTTISCRKLELTPPREGFRRLEQPLRVPMVTNGRQRLLSALELSGLYWQALYERLNRCGHGALTTPTRYHTHQVIELPPSTRAIRPFLLSPARCAG